MDQIDRRILRKSLAACDALIGKGVRIPKLSVNVSLRRLLDPRVVADIVENRPEGTRLAFELLETDSCDDDRSDVAWAIAGLSDCGVAFEVDDFGSGRASVLGLLKIRPERLKIDRPLISPIVDCARARRLVEAIAEMGRAQGIGVTAKGVETAAHVAVLRDIACDTLQGFHFARPTPLEELAAFPQARAWPRAA